MKIKEYKLARTEERHPYLMTCKEMEYDVDVFNSPYEIATLMVELYNMNELFIEYSYVLGFDYSNKLLGIIELGHQNDTKTPTPVKEMFTSLLLMGVNNFVLVHNHPNNVKEASTQDINLVGIVDTCASMLKLEFRDSIIICDDDFLSIKTQILN